MALFGYTLGKASSSYANFKNGTPWAICRTGAIIKQLPEFAVDLCYSKMN